MNASVMKSSYDRDTGSFETTYPFFIPSASAADSTPAEFDAARER